MSGGVFRARRLRGVRAAQLARISDDHVPVPQTV
jgi:hypothetical protein